MSTDDDLRDLFDKTASELSQLSSNPRNWLDWMVYFFGHLESEATDVNPNHKPLFVEMLSAFQDSIRNRLRTGGW